MTLCYQETLEFGQVQRRRVEAQFDGGEISSNGGALLLRQADRRLGLTAAMAAALGDPRRRARCTHRLTDLLRQRVYALALGYEDVDDHDRLRFDAALQTACGRLTALGSPSTVGRVERRADRSAAWVLHRVLIEQFIASLEVPPEELMLNFDATDDPAQAAQDRGGDSTQHAAYPPVAPDLPSRSAPVCSGCSTTGYQLKPNECWPRHAEKQRG